MPYRFKIDEPVEKGFRRIACAQIDVALAELAGPDIGAKGVHEYRKALKRLRALVRLATPSLAPGEGKRCVKSIGDIARLVSGRRDEAVLRETIDGLAGESGSTAANVLAPWRAHLAADRAAISRIDPQSITQMRIMLHDEVKFLMRAKVRHRGFSALKGGLESSYRRARTTLKDACREPSDESFHTFRKAVQWHWRHMSLLARAWPDEYAVRVGAARELSQILGDDHDLAALITATIQADDFSADQKEAIVELCLARQRELRDSVEPRARRLFAEKPKAFIARMSAYWKYGRTAPFPDVVPIYRRPAKEGVGGDAGSRAVVTTLETGTGSRKPQSGSTSSPGSPSQRRA